MRPTLVTPLLTRAGISVQLGAPSPFGAAEVEFAGEGILAFDPACPARLISVVVGDPRAATTTLATALGAAGARELISVDSDCIPRPITVVPGPRLAALARLALANWVHDWTTDDIPREAALLDVGLAAHRAGVPALAMQSFGGSVHLLLGVASQVLDQPVPKPVFDSLAATLEAAAVVLGPNHPEYRRLVQLHQGLLRQEPVPVVERKPEPAAILDGYGSRDREVSDLGALWDVDWMMVPPRVFSCSPGAIVRIDDDRGVRIQVSPARYVDEAEVIGLHVRLVDSAGETLAAAPLRRGADGTFESDFRFGDFPAAAAESLRAARPDVYQESADGTAPSPQVGPAWNRAAALRYAVTGLSLVRRNRAAELANGVPADRSSRAAKNAERQVMIAIRRLSDPSDSEGLGMKLSLKAWLERCDPEPNAAWPTGLPVPAADGIENPLLSEMLEVWRPELFDVGMR